MGVSQVGGGPLVMLRNKLCLAGTLALAVISVQSVQLFLRYRNRVHLCTYVPPLTFVKCQANAMGL